ncbi:hypothetical protein KUCAC02_031627, partial [Chaenocephalus aceratus]
LNTKCFGGATRARVTATGNKPIAVERLAGMVFPWSPTQTWTTSRYLLPRCAERTPGGIPDEEAP